MAEAPARFCSNCGEALVAWQHTGRLAFTAAHPREIASDVWHTLVVMLHPPALYQRVTELLHRRADEIGHEPATASTTAAVSVVRGTVLTLVPRMPGTAFNPARVDVSWREDVQETTFRMLTSASPGTRLYGTVEVFVGPLLVAVIEFGVRVTVAVSAEPRAPEATINVAMLDRIFASYSRRDSHVVDACAAVYRALGVQVVMDRADLRSGQSWRESLQSLISTSDLFQLYWSNASAASTEVANEWRYARSLRGKGTGFIRPLYWETPMPEPPPELGHLHFGRIELDQIGRLST
jgi:hypothetical protein